ncbi:MAG TPA: phytanoyl-CoA dioxygenase family protein [Ilumatobacter sp.]|nr:phytanoyl-CoA dioxygenase family protein [Ilumatobacter sp.]
MLTDEQVARFRRDGFLLLAGAIQTSELARLQRASARIVEAAVAFGRDLDRQRPIPTGVHDIPVDMAVYRDPGYLYAADGDGRRVFRRAEWLWQDDPVFALTTANPTILNAVWQLLETPFAPTTESLVVKLPEAGAAVPWHRDVELAAIQAGGGDPCHDFTIDIYLDPSTPDNGCLWAIPGSHLGLPESVEPNDWGRTDAVLVPLEPGDVLVHATGLLHGSPPNLSSDTRRTFYIHYRGPSGLSAPSTQRSIRVARECEPQQWAERQVAFLAEAIDARESAGFADPERYAGPVEVPALLPAS